jgi:MOSC domain-containing protein YiiM
MGRIEAIWVKRSVRGVMDPAEKVDLVAGKGIAGDANYGRSKRQVTVIERETFERIGHSLPKAQPHMRRANVMVSGLRLEGTRNYVLTLGSVRVLIKGETRPCERMDEQCPGLTAALSEAWGGGVYGIVLDDGPLSLGDEASLGRLVVEDVTS